MGGHIESVLSNETHWCIIDVIDLLLSLICLFCTRPNTVYPLCNYQPESKMACSGIAEHNEARRKHLIIERRAFNKKQCADRLEDDANAAMFLNSGSYENEIMYKGASPAQISKVLSPGDPSTVDKKRREYVLRQQSVEYSAKLPKRFSSTDYAAQW